MILIIILLILFIILLILGAFFSAAETTMTALSRLDVHALKEKSKAQGEKIEELLERPDRLIASLLMGNNIVNIGASAIVTYITNSYWGGIFIVLTSFVLALFVIIVLEILPKQLALRNKRQAAVILVRPMTIFYRCSSPFLDLILWLTKKIYPMIKKILLIFWKQQEGEEENLGKSLEHMIRLAYSDSSISQYERDFSLNVLDLNDKTAKQIMTHRKDVFSVEASAKLQHIYPELIENSYSRIPVYEGDQENIIGILYLNDLQKFGLHHKSQGEKSQSQDGNGHLILDFAGTTVKHLMKPVSCWLDSVRVSDLFSHFQQNQGKLVIIFDQYGGFAGVVSQEDVLETVFGKLYDEDETESALLIHKEASTFVFSGMLSIQQFEEFFHTEIKVEENTRLATISGYICDFLGLIPEQGQRIERPEGVFWVLESDGKRIVTLRFELGKPATAPSSESLRSAKSQDG